MLSLKPDPLLNKDPLVYLHISKYTFPPLLSIAAVYSMSLSHHASLNQPLSGAFNIIPIVHCQTNLLKTFLK